MKDRQTVVLLPGFDGTGLLMQGFARVLADRFTVWTIAYPCDQAYDYDALTKYVLERLPDDEYILIGESFSGPLVLRIAAENPPGLMGVVLGASFARLDLPFKMIVSSLAKMISVRRVPMMVLNSLLMGGQSTPDQRALLREALKRVSPHVLTARLKAALSVDLIHADLTVSKPLLYLRATEDKLIPKNAANWIALVAGNRCIREVRAPHFLFQTAPEECRRILIDCLGMFSPSF